MARSYRKKNLHKLNVPKNNRKQIQLMNVLSIPIIDHCVKLFKKYKIDPGKNGSLGYL